MTEDVKQQIIDLFQEYTDIFAWSLQDMPRIDESVAIHKLNVDHSKKPVKQKCRNFAPDRQIAIDEEASRQTLKGRSHT